jgi:hypothetical protein
MPKLRPFKSKHQAVSQGDISSASSFYLLVGKIGGVVKDALAGAIPLELLPIRCYA